MSDAISAEEQERVERERQWAIVQAHSRSPEAWAEEAGAEREKALRDAILDICAHSTQVNLTHDHDFVEGFYITTIGSLHRALGIIGHTAPPALNAPAPIKCEHGGGYVERFQCFDGKWLWGSLCAVCEHSGPRHAGAPVEPVPADRIAKAIEGLQRTRSKYAEGFKDAWISGKIAGLSEAINYLSALAVEPVPAPRLEWEEENFGWSASHFQIEYCMAGERKFVSLAMDYPFPDEDVLAAKSLAEKLNTVLSPPVGPQE